MEVRSGHDSVVVMGGSEVDITLDLSEGNLDDNTFFDSLDSEVEPTADIEFRILDTADTFDCHLKALSSFFADLVVNSVV